MTNVPIFLQVLNGPQSEEGDPVLSCVFKTEFITHFMTATNGQAQSTIGPACVPVTNFTDFSRL